MVVVIEIKGAVAVERYLKEISNALPYHIREGSNDFGKFLEYRLRLNIVNKRLVDTGILLKNTRWHRRRDGGYISTLRRGLALDHGEPHYVKIARGRRIYMWAGRKGNDGVKALRRRQGSLFVKPHPWIEQPIHEATQMIQSFMKKRVDMAVRKA